MNRLTAAVSTALFLCALQVSAGSPDKQPVDYVNPLVGNISHLLVPTFPTVHLPNAMLRVYPERGDYTSDRINGLPVAVTSHRGQSAFNISPLNAGEDRVNIVRYSYDNEVIKPYYYSVFLDEKNIEVRYSPSFRSGIYEFEFGGNDGNSIVINSRNGHVASDGDGVSGYQHINRNTRIFLYAETDIKPVLSSEINDGNSNAVVLKFGKAGTVRLRYGISFISEEQAKQNLRNEITGYDIDAIIARSRSIWNGVLGKIAVTGGTEDEKTVFYTSLYRTYERMINISEYGRYYSAFDGKVHDDEGTPFYTDDWIWDTYRATHPLRVLIEPEMERDMIRSFIRMAEQDPNGWMPTFPEVTGDSHRMNGNHAVATIWDAWCKGITGFDFEAAYLACKGAITEKTLLPWKKEPLTPLDVFYKENGYFPALAPGEPETFKEVHGYEKRQSISVMLGNAYDNWCLAQMAKELGREEEYRRFTEVSYTYRNVYNSETGFFHPRNIDGKFIDPFDYRWSGGQGARDYYGENNGWIYRWDVQHNPADLIELMGGREKFTEQLDRTFNEPLGKSKFDFYATLPDHTGNVGQFSMANEPCLHIPYLYNYAGQPWKTQKRIRTLLSQWFRNDLMGIPGDEDGGGMTAFVVFSMLGFYPVTPGMPSYNIGSPVFERARIDLGSGKYFEIIANNYSPENKYIQSAQLNGKDWNQPWFSHSDIANGGTLVLEMGNKANRRWGSSVEAAPPSAGVYTAR